MGAAILVNELYSAGKKLITSLDEAGYGVPTAFLAKSFEDEYSWSLVLAMDGVKTDGSRKYYQAIQHLIAKESIPISLSDIRVIDSNDPLVQSLHKIVQTGREINKVNFFGNYINGQRFPDAVIYRAS